MQPFVLLVIYTLLAMEGAAAISMELQSLHELSQWSAREEMELPVIKHLPVSEWACLIVQS